MKVAVLRECLRSNWHGENEMNWTFRDVPSASFYFWGETPPEDADIYDVSELFHNRSIDYIQSKNRVIVTTEEPSVLATLKYLRERNIKLDDLIDKPVMYVVRSTWVRDTLLQLGVHGEKMIWIPFADNINRFVPRTLPRMYDFPVYLYVGSINTIKGVDILLDSFGRLDKGHLLLVAGQFNNDDTLVERAKKIKNVHVHPWRDDIEYYYNQADIYVQPQSFGKPLEGGILHFGKPLQWALASGLPLISLDQGSARDFILNNVNGFLCQYHGDISVLMEQLSKTPKTVEDMGIQSRRLAAKFYSSANTGARYNALCEALIRCYK